MIMQQAVVITYSFESNVYLQQAHWFSRFYGAKSMDTRDNIGHGTNTASTATGNHVNNLSCSTGQELVMKMRKMSNRFIAIHLRFEPDMLAFSGCYYGGGDKERNQLAEIRKRWETLPVRLIF
ncbi:O-fucosyltransferase [Thalictrum thalictroides]|uniref:O-fucosyltransferase family protein n=1 Tax=Thalictrum thalictroides TaxID=46969 RepID=A0A7J6UV96_THATH|nr:O-fucosyltransferase [Thalictrum thalictroides]